MEFLLPHTLYLSPLFQAFYLQAHVLAHLPPHKTSEILFSYSPFYFLLNLKQAPLSITSHHLRPSVWLSLLLLLSPEVMEQVPEKRWDDCYQILVVSILRC